MWHASNYNTISGNTVNYNTKYGITLNSDCNYNTISDNTANYNEDEGIRLNDNCDDNTILGNTINNTDYRIYLWSSNNTIISGNFIENSQECGINITDVNSQNSKIYYNSFIGISNKYANDGGTNNHWNTTNVGNYWENHTSPDVDNDGIVDDPYIWISGGPSVDNFPLVENPIHQGEKVHIDDSGVSAWNWTKTARLKVWVSGSGIYTDPFIINGLEIDGGGTGNGIKIENSIVYFIIKNCKIYNTGSGSEDAGIVLEEVNNGTLRNNNCSNNGRSGICLLSSEENTISGNTANYNDIYGILLITDCNYNTISDNTVNNNTYGIILAIECDDNTISGNTANYNDIYGIWLSTDCHNNTISDNTANNNYHTGIYLNQYCDNNTLSGNTVNKNSRGIYLENNCDNNTITENVLYNNTQGIRIASGCDNNSIYKNFFLENGIHAIDDGTDNHWNSTSIGNYWDNWTSPDADSDGIVDDPYTHIGGSAESIDHLPIAEDGAPTISINSPVSGDTFSITAPSFNVIITDDYLDKMWYTIDGGLNNYSFTENGMISQSAWNKAAEGNITLTFYASDIPGNIGTEEVMIAKDYEAPIINIISPTTGEFFGSSAPSFNVRIIDDYLDTMWYTLDGGLHNYTFTANGTIVQSAWNSMGDGAIIIGFFANDTLGHIGSAGMTLHKDTVTPVIIITSLKEGDRFGSTAPLFNITVTEINLDEIWYSYDEGLTIFAITDNGTLNQAAWTALAQGEITITFYASDLAGNEASESVTVTKSVPSELDTGVIITIIIVSVVGGVAVITVVYIFMKKRVAPA